MGKYATVRADTGWGMPGPGSARHTADELAALLELSRHADAKARTVAVANLCPCHVRSNDVETWDRLLEMTTDPAPLVRRAVVHALADGSPKVRRDQVISALDALRNDPDRVVRRQVHRVLGEFRRTGRVNVL